MGTPSMSAAKVASDLKVVQNSGSVAVLQEFKWPWYWGVAKRVYDDRWHSYPGFVRGLASPTDSAQCVQWRGSVWKRIGKGKQRLLHPETAGVSENRWARAVLLEDRQSSLRCWFATAHFVVSGDKLGSDHKRQDLMGRDLDALNDFLEELASTGYPIWFEGDLNINPGGWAYRELARMLISFNATVHGQHGVEFTFTIDGHTTQVEVVHAWRIGGARLNTDHEIRGTTFRLVDRA